MNTKFEFNRFSQFRAELMGIAILGVLIEHGISWMELGSTILTKPFEWFARIAFTEGFLFLSGLGLYYSFTRDSNIRSFYDKRIKRLVIPFMIMALPFYLCSWMAGEDSFSEFFLKETSLYFWLYGNNGMWYISLSILLYFLFPFIYRGIHSDKSFSVRNYSIIFITTIVLIVSLCLFKRDYYYMTGIAISKIPMFLIGMLAGYLSISSKRCNLIKLSGGGYRTYINRPMHEEGECCIHSCL